MGLGFLNDLINRPEVAIETIDEKRNKKLTVGLIVTAGMLVLTNFYIAHLFGSDPQVVYLILILAVIGILIEFSFMLGFVVDLYVFQKLTRYKPAGEVCRTISWCFLVPTVIFHLGLFLVNLLLISIGRVEWIGYLYDTGKWVLYIWILGLSFVAITKYQPEHKIRNILGVLGTFALNWGIWTYLNAALLHTIFTTFI